jgi:hypothetical protein
MKTIAKIAGRKSSIGGNERDIKFIYSYFDYEIIPYNL